MQVDPIGYKDDLDLYTYVGDDPINRTDPQGTVLKLVVGVVKMAIKGENLYSTVQGIVENVQTIADPAASTAEKALAALSIVMDVTSGINVKDVKAVANAVEKTSYGKRVEDFTPSQNRQAKVENAARNGGQMRCERCDKPIENIANKSGVPTPDNQAQVHHDPPIHAGGTRASSKRVVVCPSCHKKEHHPPPPPPPPTP